MAGTQTTQKEALISITDQWADHVCSGRLTHTKAWFLLMWCIMKMLEYRFIATSLMKKECDKIMQPIFDAGLTALGLSRTMKDVIYGSRRYQGVGIPNLWLPHPKAVDYLSPWRHRYYYRQFFTSGAGLTYHIELGLPRSFLSHNYYTYSHLATNA
jgi:hypothetical protein